MTLSSHVRKAKQPFSDRFWWLLFALAIALSGLNYADAQVPVSILTPPRFQSLLGNGQPNAFGCVWTYANGTTNPITSYSDYLGLNIVPNPVPLDASGSASIWLTSGTLYTIVIKTSGGLNCASGSTLSTTNGVNGSLLNLANVFNQTQGFLLPVNLLAADLQIKFGSIGGTQTTLDIPPTAGNFVLHGPPITGDDTLLSQNAAQPLQNKNLTTGTQVNGCGMTNGPGTYICVPNNSSTATLLNGLAALTGNPSTATTPPISAQSGVVGIVVAGAGITDNATIQQSGTANCNFDGGTTAGDYVVPSAARGDCHDAGANYPTLASGAAQIVGVVTATGTGLQPVNLTGIGLQPTVPLNVLGQNAIASVVPGTGAGTGGTASCQSGATCLDNGGIISVTSGTLPTSGGTIATITFGGTHLGANCTLSPWNNPAQILTGAAQVAMLPGTTTFTILGGALNASSNYQWDYVCSFH